MFFKSRNIPATFAAVDLGSNSFHLIIAENDQGNIRIIDHIREPVGLSRDLKATGMISDDARERALRCLEKFGQRVKEIPRGWVNAVGTNTFRKAGNASEFLQEAHQALGHPIDIISGPEEARLIYLGVAHGQNKDETRRLVFDIGGSSSELIYGVGASPTILESFDVGCVTLSAQHFADGQIAAKRFQRAKIHARNLFEEWAETYRSKTWDIVIGTSGTIRAIDTIMAQSGVSREGITADGLNKLTDQLIQLGSCSEIAKQFGVDKARANNLPGGLAILSALFDTFKIQTMQVSDKALRQGLLYDLVGSKGHDDIRSQSIEQIARRFYADPKHTNRVLDTANNLYEQVCQNWNLQDSDAKNLLQWAIPIHEIGLCVSHSQHHKHGAYLVENCDLLGFSRFEQKVLSLLIRAQRRKLPNILFEGFTPETQELLLKVISLMRLAIVLNRNRSDQFTPGVTISLKKNTLHLEFPQNWLSEHPLTLADLEYEAGVLGSRGVNLVFS